MQNLLLLAMAMSSLLTDGGQGFQTTIRETTLVIPTYATGADDKNPPLENLNVYPYSMQTGAPGEKVDRQYRAVVLENEWIRVIILPDVGGRIYAAHDKSNDDFDFIYHNRVIKPGLVALRGAWLSGGIEWNFPTRGHTVNTVSPVQYRILRGDDGSVTCVVGATEWVRRMRWSVATTVYPDRSCFENRICVQNPTLVHNRAYFWANAAVHAWDDTQVIFPAADHTFAGMRRNPEPWPINHGKDMSWYKNTPYPHDYFCGATGDFQGAYHHDRDCGSVHCASRHSAFGKKFWTWGTARSGAIWEDLLTDEDGQYIEVQSGRLWTQGDTWILEPHMQESWSEYWYPIQKTGGFVKANPQAAVNCVAADGELQLAVQPTRRLEEAILEVSNGETVLLRETVSIDPSAPWKKTIPLPPAAAKAYCFAVRDSHGRDIIDYRPEKPKLPKPELEPEFPAAGTATAEETYFQGYYAMKHWQLPRAIELFEESLEKDPGFTPALRSLAVVHYKQGRYEQALAMAERVLHRNDDDLTARYYRGLAKVQLGIEDRTEEDFDLIGRRAEYRHISPYVQASRAIRAGDMQRAEVLLRQSVRVNPDDRKARAVLAAVLSRRGEREEAQQLLAAILAEDPIHCLAAVEEARLGDASHLAVLRGDPQNYLETACDYLEMNLWKDAGATLALACSRATVEPHPFVHFYRGYLADRDGQNAEAAEHYRCGMELSTDYVFPFRNESIAVLETGLRHVPDGWKLHYYLGTLLLAKLRWQEGREHLLAAEKASPACAVLYRNLGEIYAHESHEPEKAIAAYRQAIRIDPNDYTYYLALDKLLAGAGRNDQRKTLFDAAPDEVKADFRVRLKYANYLVDVGQEDQALEILLNHAFHPWEGWNAGREVYLRALHQRADRHFASGRYEEAIADLRQAMEYPENLGTGKPHEPDYAREHCKLGLCHKAMNRLDLARDEFRKALAAPKATHEGRDWHAMASEELKKLAERSK